MPHSRGCMALAGCRAFRFAPYPPLPPKLQGALAAAALRADVNMWDQVNGGPEMNERHTHSRLSVDHLYHVAGGRLRLAEGAAVAALVCRPGGRAQDVRDRRVIDHRSRSTCEPGPRDYPGTTVPSTILLASTMRTSCRLIHEEAPPSDLPVCSFNFDSTTPARISSTLAHACIRAGAIINSRKVAT